MLVEPRRPVPVFISIHDVAPDTLGQVDRLLRLLQRHRLGPIDLLVIPGLAWDASALQQLRDWQAAGHRLAGHGWRHRARARRTLWHRLHGAVLSRDVAEHLSRSGEEIATLIRNCFDWFGAADLEPPVQYVPPAWALGAISRSQLQRLPFRFYESLGGIYDSRRDRYHRLPLWGYEADTRFRQIGLRFSNRVNRSWATAQRPLRVSIHPRDLDLRLAARLQSDLAELAGLPWRAGSVSQWASDATCPA